VLLGALTREEASAGLGTFGSALIEMGSIM
jgi:hypothetical protein